MTGSPASPASKVSGAFERILEAERGGDESARAEILAGLPPDARSEVEGLLADLELIRARRAEIGHGPESGLRLGPYKLERRIGQGGASTVWEALDPRLDRRVAIKVLHPHLALSKRQVDRFEREARLVASLQHPGICKLLDVGVEDGLHYLVQELVPEGRTLLDLIAERGTFARGADGIREMAAVMRRVCEAVGAVHARRVAHRDLKPNNILLRLDGEPVVSDFGLAAITEEEDLGLTSVKAGTPFYLSPEQVEGQSHADVRSDVFSLGVTLYECLSGLRPFDGESAVVVGRKIVEAEPEPLRRLRPSIPADLAAVCSVALEKDPKRRYPDAGAMAADLARFLKGAPVVARPTSRPRRWIRSLRKRPVLLAGVAGLLGVAFVGVIYALQVAEYDSRLRAQSALLERTLEAAEFFTSGPLLNLGPETPEVLLELAEAARDDFAEDPNGQAQILSTVGDIYAGIGLFTLASEHYAEAATAIESMKLDSAAAVDLRIAQLRSLEYDFQAERSIELGESLLTQAAVLGDPIRSARVRSMLSSSYAFLQMDEAQAELEERFGAVTDQVETALQGLKVGADAPEQKLELRRLLARELLNERRFEEALEAATQTLDEHVALYGREDLRTLMAAYQRGRSLGRLWANRSLRSVESQPPLEFAQAILEEARGWAGETSRVALEMRWLVAEFQLSSGQPGRAFENYDFVARHYGKWIGEENPRYLSLLCARAITATKLGAAQQAVETLDRVIAVRERVVGADHFNTLIARRARAEALLRLGRFEEAEHEFVRVWERFRSQGGFRGTEGIVHSAFYLGDTLTHLGRFEEGIEWLRRTQEILSEEQGPEEALDIAYYSNWLEMLDALLRRDPQGLNSVVAATKSRFPEKSVDVRPFEIAGALLAGDALPPSRAELLADASHVAVEVAAIELAREYAAGDVERARSLAQRVNLEGAAYGRLWNEGYTPSMQVLSQLLASAMREAVGEDLLPIERQILQRLDVE